MKSHRAITCLPGLLLCGALSSACDAAPSKGAPALVKAEKGQVLVTNRLDVDFAAYKVTFIEIGADRCIPCRKMQPIMKEVAAEFPEDVQVVFYDVWKDPAPGREYGIQLIPTQVFIDANGREVDRHVGFFAKEELVAVLIKQGAKK
jgi:thiol-disulfide isomerase/thioredoxin